MSSSPSAVSIEIPVSPLERRRRLRARLAEAGLDALLVTSMDNVRYLTGFTGSTGALVVSIDGDDLLVTDGRYDRQTKEEVTEGVDVEIATDPPLQVLRVRLGERGAGRVACEGEHLSVAAWGAWEEGAGSPLEPVSGWIEALRAVKSPAEIDAIRRAARVADETFEEIVSWLRPGVTEREAAARIDLILAERGAEGRAFETIAAFGERSALPHARPGARELRAGDVALLDFGAVVEGYRSDLTRTVACGGVGESMMEVHAVVLRAQTAALEGLRTGMSGREADALARDVIEAAGYGDGFSHSLGHGIGLAVHEEPRLSRKNETDLQAGMTVTVEPGVYVPGIGGVRIEDDVLLTGEGAVRLTSAPREMKVLEGWA